MPKPNPDLYDRIITQINYENRLLMLKRRVFLYSLSLLVTTAVSVPLLIRLYADIFKSGLIEYLSLLFTDFQTVAANLGDYSWSILESLPAMSFSLAVLLAAVFIFSYSKFSASLMEMRKLHSH